MNNFQGKVAVVTGAASGIGEGLARHCAAQGMAVVLADVNQARLDALASELSAAGGRALAVVTDVSKPEQVQHLADTAYAEFGAVHLLFNNAGVLIAGNSWERSNEDWQWILGINLMGVIYGVNAFLPRMLEQGGDAHIVNTSSLAGLLAAPLMGPYTTGKQAVVGYTETLYYELKERAPNIGVSVLCPGPVATAIIQSGDHRPAKPNPAEEALKAMLNGGVSAGITPAQAAEIVFDKIRAGRFWIFTHEDFKPEYRSRIERVIASENPQYQVYVTEK